MPQPSALRFGLALLLFAGAASAQSLDGRPFHALSADALGAHQSALELGTESRWGITPVPVLGPTRGTLVQLPIVRYRMGLGRGEFGLGWPVYQWLDPDDGTDQSDDFGDVSFTVTLEALRQKSRRPALGVMFGTKLPIASEPTRLGTDETDIRAAILLSHAGEKHELRFNVGIALIEDPLEDSAQEDVLTYALAGRQGRQHSFLWEIYGQSGGSDPVRDLSEGTVRLGYGHYGERRIFDVSLLVGFEENSGDVGVTGGATFLFGEGR